MIIENNNIKFCILMNIMAIHYRAMFSHHHSSSDGTEIVVTCPVSGKSRSIVKQWALGGLSVGTIGEFSREIAIGDFFPAFTMDERG
jgi:hypothetical protein